MRTFTGPANCFAAIVLLTTALTFSEAVRASPGQRAPGSERSQASRLTKVTGRLSEPQGTCPNISFGLLTSQVRTSEISKFANLTCDQLVSAANSVQLTSNDTQDIRGLISVYENGYEREDVGAIAKVWETLSEDLRTEYQRNIETCTTGRRAGLFGGFFRPVASQQIQLNIADVEIVPTVAAMVDVRTVDGHQYATDVEVVRAAAVSFTEQLSCPGRASAHIPQKVQQWTVAHIGSGWKVVEQK